MTRDTGPKKWFSPVLTGGLNTQFAPHQVGPSHSPTENNISMSAGSIAKRGGFVPFIKQRPKMNGVENRGYRARGYTSGAEATYVNVPGHMLAGHRKVYETLGAQRTIQFHFQVGGELETTHGGNGVTDTGDPWPAAPFTVHVRPVISKGPVKKHHVLGAETLPAGGWDATNAYGPNAAAGDYGMPFCIYLWNDSGTWRWRLSFHVVNGANFEIVHVTEAVWEVEPGDRFHVIASIDVGNTAILRVGKWFSTFGGYFYNSVTQSLAGFTAVDETPTPIQVFDCPQAFIENAAAPSATATQQPPGLGLTAGSDGGYFWNAIRAEGTIEDVSILSSVLSSPIDESMDTHTKLARPLPSEVVSHWDFLEPGDNYVAEVTGRGNHLYFAPDVPSLGSRSAAGWWFNGSTSYAMPALFPGGVENPNWRTIAEGDPSNTDDRAFVRRCIDGASGFGVAVAFWCESIGEPFEQTLAEIHSVIRIVIDTDGRLRAYARGSGVLNTYDPTPVVSSFVLEPGERYYVTATMESGDIVLYVDDVEDARVTITSPTQANYPPGGFTWGAGCVSFTSQTADVGGHADDKTAAPDQLNIDYRSVFIGTIEEVKVVCGALREPLDPKRRDEIPEDWRYEQSRLWASPTATVPPRTAQVPFDAYDPLDGLEAGLAVAPAAHFANQSAVRYISTNSTGTTVGPSMLTLEDGGQQGGVIVGLRPGSQVLFYYVLSRWVLDQDDERLTANGFYEREVEFRHQVSLTPITDAYRGTFVQRSLTVDDLGVLSVGPFGVERRSIEPDTITEVEDVTLTNPQRSWGYMWRGIRPHIYQSPWEQQPRWVQGMLTPAADQTRITMLADFQHQVAGENFIIGAAGRHVFWCKPIWRRDSPIKSEAIKRSLWSFGQPDDYVLARASSLTRQALAINGSWSYQTVEFWVKPQRLDGFRLAAAKGTPTLNLYNWLIGFRNGSLVVASQGGTANGSWMYEQASFTGTSGAGANQDIRLTRSSLRLDEWNHVVVEMGGPGPAVAAWINGQSVSLALHASTSYTADAIGSTAPQVLDGQLYILGFPSGFHRVLFESTTDSMEVEWDSWCGLISDFRIRDAAHASPGVVPKSRLATDANTVYLFPFTSGEGWCFLNESTAFPDDGGSSVLTEVVPIGSGLSEPESQPYRYAVYRDKLHFTNGVSKPQQLSFSRFSDPDGPFFLSQLGMDPGISTFSSRKLLYAPNHPDHPDGLTSSYYMSTGLYLAYCTFIDAVGRESEPVLLLNEQVEEAAVALPITGVTNPATDTYRIAVGSAITADILPGQQFTVRIVGALVGLIVDGIYTATEVTTTSFDITVPGATGTAGAGGSVDIFYDAVRLLDVPRSTDPQVTGRRFYLSAPGGGVPILALQLDDNVTKDVDLVLPLEGPTIEIGRHLTPPRARHIAVGNGTVLLGNLPRLASGGNAFAWSDATEVSYFPLENQVVIDSEDGRAITGMANHVGKFFIFKRDSTWLFSYAGQAPGAPTGAYLVVLNKSSAVGGGAKVKGNLIFGAGNRGAEAFNGSSFQYLGEMLEGEWPTLPLTDDDVSQMHSALNRDRDEWMLSVKVAGGQFASRLYVLSSQPTGLSWNRWTVQRHTTFGDVEDPLTQQPTVVMGTIQGQILRYEETTYVDGAQPTLAVPAGSGTGVLQGTAASHTTTTLTLGSGEFDVVHEALRGLPMALDATIGGETIFVAFARVVSVDAAATTLTFELITPANLAVIPQGTLDFAIGNYDAFWTSGWIAPQPFGQDQIIQGVDLDYAASTGANTDLLLQTAVANQLVPHAVQFPAQNESFTVDLTTRQRSPAHTTARVNGRYFRILFGTQRIFDPFSVNGWGYRYTETGIMGAPR